MKKIMNKTKWLGIPLLELVVATIPFIVTSCSNNDVFMAQSYSSGTNIVNRLTIDVIDRDVSIKSHNSNEITVNYYISDKEYYDISYSASKELLIKYATNKNWTDYIGLKASRIYRKIDISIPYQLLDDLSITTTNGIIQASSIEISNSISFNSDGGDIDINKIGSNKAITLTTKNGNINGSIIGNINNFTVTCEIKKGNSNLPAQTVGSNKILNVNCNNGDVNIDFVNN